MTHLRQLSALAFLATALLMANPAWRRVHYRSGNAGMGTTHPRATRPAGRAAPGALEQQSGRARPHVPARAALAADDA